MQAILDVFGHPPQERVADISQRSLVLAGGRVFLPRLNCLIQERAKDPVCLAETRGAA